MRAVVLAMLLGPVAASSAVSSAENPRWITVEYREQQQVVVPCSVGLLCTVNFARGEVLGDGFAGDSSHWKIMHSYSANSMPAGATPELLVQPTAAKQHTNMVIFARNTPRQYRILFESVTDDRPTYVRFAYNAEANAYRRAHPPVVKPVAVVQPPTLLETIDAACKAQTDGYTADDDKDRRGRVDSLLTALRPARICRDANRTYIQMPPRATADIDLPVPFEDAAGGVTQANYHYYEAERVFVVNSVANIVLRLSVGKRVVDMHIRRTSAEGTL